jgi:hypothetical protein
MMGNAYKILVGKFEQNIILLRPRCRWEDNTMTYIGGNKVCVHVESISVTESCEHDNARSCCKTWEIF